MTKQRKKGVSAEAMTLGRGGRDVLQVQSLAFDGGMGSSLLIIGGQSTVQTQRTGRWMDKVESSLDSVQQYKGYQLRVGKGCQEWR